MALMSQMMKLKTRSEAMAAKKTVQDPMIAYWASLCESEDNVNEAYEKPYAYDVEDERKPIATVKDLKEVLSHFKDNDTLQVVGLNDTSFVIKVMWNANMEYEMTGDDPGDDICFIKVVQE